MKSKVSYSWKYTFDTLLQCIRKHERDHPTEIGSTTYYYIDQFAHDQHRFTDFTKSSMSEEERQRLLFRTLNRSIEVPGKVLSILHPWIDPVPLRRVWCLFELYRGRFAISSSCVILMF